MSQAVPHNLLSQTFSAVEIPFRSIIRTAGTTLDVQAAAGEMRKVLVALKKKVQDSCDYVGERFPEEARKIHYGDSEARDIYGEASPEEARELEDEGVTVQRIPWVAEGN